MHVERGAGDGGGRGVTLGETFDLLDIPIGEIAPDDGDRFDTIEIVIGEDTAVEDDLPEPTLAAAPFFIEFDEPARLDPKRSGLVWEVPPALARAIRLRSPFISLAFHLLPIVAIILFPLIAIEPPPPIPVQLVFEQPPPPPPPAQPAPKPPQLQQPPRGPLSSIDQGQVKPPEPGQASSATPPAAGETQQNQVQTQTTAALTPPPPPEPMPKPTPPKEHQPAFQLPKPSGAPVARHEETPHEAPHAARYAGAAATRDEYLAYLVALTRQHMDLLPLSVIGDRRGETVISVVVQDNGAIGPLGVLRSSGYPDIDHRIEEMVAAVHKFPPLPQWYQGNAVQLELTLKFPEALEQR